MDVVDVVDVVEVTAEVTEAEVWVDKALASDLSLLADDGLVATAGALSVLAAKVDALRVKVAAAVDSSGVWADREHGNAAGLLRSLTPNRHPGEASSAVRHGSRVQQMPHARAAFESGAITQDHIRVLGECLHPRYEGQFAEFEEELVRYAIELSFDDFKKLIGAWKSWADDAVDTERDIKDARAREVHLSRAFNNRGALSGTLSPIARSVVDSELRRLEQLLFTADWAAAVERLGEGNVTREALRRGPAQRRHDALVWMAMRSRVADGDAALAEPMLYVHTTEADMVDALEHLGAQPPAQRPRFDESRRELEDGTRISRRALAKLTVRSKIRRVVFGPTGELIDAGRTRRWFSRLQRDLVAARDRVCACGCGLPARYCEIDHVTEWRDGGTTDLANAQPLCSTAHRNKTNSAARQKQRSQTQREAQRQAQRRSSFLE